MSIELLIAAVKEQNIEQVQAILLEGGLNLNVFDEEGVPPLFYAIASKNLEICKLLIAHDANPRIVDQYGYTALHFAAASKCGTEILQLLIENGANINAETSDEHDVETVASVAASNGNFEALQFLFNNGAEISNILRNDRGITYEIVRSGNVPMLKLLLQETLRSGEVNINDINVRGQRLLHIAASASIKVKWDNGENFGGLNFSSSPHHIEFHNDGLQELIHIVVSEFGSGSVSILAPEMDNLIKMTDNITVSDKNGQEIILNISEHKRNDAPLTITLKHGEICFNDKEGKKIWGVVVNSIVPNIEILDLLIKNGADLNIVDNAGNTLFLRAISNACNVEVLEFLIEKGANIRDVNHSRETALHLAAQSANIEVVQFLLEQGLYVNVRDMNGCTPFLEAIKSGNVAILNLLVDNGANIEDVNLQGNGALHFAAESPNVEVLKWVVNKGINLFDVNYFGETALHFAAQRANIEAVQWLLEQGLYVNVSNNHGYTPFLKAISSGNIALLNFLVKKGANITYVDHQGNGALHLAARSSNVEVFKWVVNKGVNLFAENYFGETALYLASEGSNTEIAEYLLDQGLDVNIRNSSFRSPLHVAAEQGSFNVLKLLVARGGDVNLQYNNHNTQTSTSVLDLLADDQEHLNEILQIADNFNNLYNAFASNNFKAFYEDPSASLERRWDIYRKYYKEQNIDLPGLAHFKKFLTKKISDNLGYNAEEMSSILSLPDHILTAEILKSEITTHYSKASFLLEMYNDLFNWINVHEHKLYEATSDQWLITFEKTPAIFKLLQSEDLKCFIMHYMDLKVLAKSMRSMVQEAIKQNNHVMLAKEETKEDFTGEEEFKEEIADNFTGAEESKEDVVLAGNYGEDTIN